MDTRGRVALATVLAVLLAATATVGWQQIVVEQDAWILFDWLISYDGGPVRRGLAGTAIWAVADLTPFTAPQIVWGVVVACYGVMYAAAWYLLARAGLHRRFWLLVAAPFLFSYPLLFPEAGFRKEVLLLAVVGAVAAATRDATPWARTNWVVGGGAILGVLALAHVVMAVFAPLLLFFAWPIRLTRGQAVAAAGAAAALAAAVGFAATHPGDAQAVAAVCTRIAGALPPTGSIADCGTVSAVAWLDKGTVDAWGMIVGRPDMVVGLPVAVGMVALALFPAVVAAPSRRLLVRFTGAATVIAGTMMLVAVDWGRFVYIVAVIVAIQTFWDGARNGHRDVLEVSPQLAGATAALYAVAWSLGSHGTMVRTGWIDRLLS